MEHTDGRVFHVRDSGLHDRDEFPIDETHGIATWTQNRLTFDSSGLGWRDAYVSCAVESTWEASLLPSRHVCLAYCARGAADIRRHVEGETAEHSQLLTGRFGLIPAARHSTWRLNGNPEVQHLYIHHDTLDTVARAEYDRSAADIELVPRIGFTDPLLEQLVLELRAAIHSPSYASSLLAGHIAALATLRLLREHSTLTRHRPRDHTTRDPFRQAVAETRDRIDADPAAHHSLADLASHAGLAPHRLAAAFRRGTGITLHRYLIARRLDLAKTLLTHTDTPIADIAHQAGFASQSHLTTTLKRHTGLTPAAFRREP